MQMSLDFNKLKENKQLIFIIAVLAITVFFGKKVWDKTSRELVRMNQEIANSQKMISLAEDVAKLSEEFGKFRGIGWPLEETVEIMSGINQIVNKHNLQISTLQPAGFNKQENYSTFTLNLDIVSDYFGLTQFLAEIENLKELTRVIAIQIMPEQGSVQAEEPSVRAVLSITAFIAKN